ncbi:hybrid sensor histidine kinase/response regulator [Aquabacterium sp. J223]|uniref:ATP-binding response regulator n=1 Tax=Aquabacterium sp. J223 TaxID=2898431 RepID=UPI0021ADD2EC|nr:hybrid sensor histidine kinase/response regulator [Aquabacterium sp. J223]UUX97174.1 hybrid sensor histidine kinase/response regulator [Aquabacterium sp. J223]
MSSSDGAARPRASDLAVLFRRYLLAAALLVLAMMAALGTYQAHAVWRDTEAALQQRHRLVVWSATQQLGAALDRQVGQLRGSLRQLEGWSRLDGALREQEVYRLLKSDNAFTAARLHAPAQDLLLQAGRVVNDGLVHADTDAPDWPEPDRVDAPSFGPVFRHNGSAPRVRIVLGGRSAVSGRPNLYLGVETALHPLSAELRRLLPSPRSALYLVDRDGRIVVHSEQQQTFAAVGWNDLHPGVAAPTQQVDLLRLNRGGSGDGVITTASFPPLQATLVLEQPWDEAWRPVRTSIQRSIVATVFVLAATLLVVMVPARRMTSLVSRLAGAHERIRAQALALQDLNVALDRRTLEAERANLAKTRFIVAASHDLHQPMQAIALLADVLSRHVDEKPDPLLVQQLQDAAGAMGQLFQGILDMSRLEAGAVAVRRGRTSIDEVLSRVVAQTRPQAARNRVALHWHRSPNVRYGDTDALLLERIVLNLVGNAVRYTPAGGRVLIGCRPRGGTLKIEVWDTGIGIADADRERIFEEFTQLGAAVVAPERERGLGLGLAVVSRLSALLGHRVTVCSLPGRGSRFTLALPMADAPAAPAAGPDGAAHALDAQLPDHARGAFVIVIDDDAAVRQALGLALDAVGCPRIVAASADEALHQLEQHQRLPDLVISDHRLGKGRDGVSAIAELRTALGDPELPAAVLSGDLAEEDLRAIHAAGLPLLHKPLRLRQLVEVLGRVRSA